MVFVEQPLASPGSDNVSKVRAFDSHRSLFETDHLGQIMARDSLSLFFVPAPA